MVFWFLGAFSFRGWGFSGFRDRAFFFRFGTFFFFFFARCLWGNKRQNLRSLFSFSAWWGAGKVFGFLEYVGFVFLFFHWFFLGGWIFGEILGEAVGILVEPSFC